MKDNLKVPVLASVTLKAVTPFAVPVEPVILTFPVPFGVSLIPILESLPVALNTGLLPVIAPVKVIPFTNAVVPVAGGEIVNAVAIVLKDVPLLP